MRCKSGNKSTMRCRAFLLLVALFVPATGHSQIRTENVFLMENFDTLLNWESLTFPKIKKHSVYTIITDKGGSLVRAESSGSASALQYKKTFNVYAYPNIRWRWKAEKVYEQGSVKTREGDDYPIRVYIIFPSVSVTMQPDAIMVCGSFSEILH